MYPDFKNFVLDNGLTIYIARTAYYKLTNVRFVVHSGGRDGKGGLAHFTEHMVFGHIDEPYKLSDNCGGSVMLGITYSQNTSYGFSLPKSKLAKGFDMFGTHLLCRSINENTVETERRIIINEHRENGSRSLHIAEDFMKDFHKSLYGNLWKSTNIYPGLGYLEEISQINKADIESFYNQHYVPANISVVILTPEPIAKVLALIKNSTLATMKAGARNPRLSASATVDPPEISRWNVKYHSDSLITKCIIPGTVSEATLVILTLMIGNNLQELIFKHLQVYYPKIERSFYGDCWQIAIYCYNIINGSNEQLKKIIDELLLTTFKSKANFNRCKKKLIFNSINLDLSLGAAYILEEAESDLIIYGKIQNIFEKINSYKSVKFSDIQALEFYFYARNRSTISSFCEKK